MRPALLKHHLGPCPGTSLCPARLQVFQSYMLMLAQAPDTSWPIPEQLLGLGQDAWVQSTKKIK